MPSLKIEYPDLGIQETSHQKKLYKDIPLYVENIGGAFTDLKSFSAHIFLT